MIPWLRKTLQKPDYASAAAAGERIAKQAGKIASQVSSP